MSTALQRALRGAGFALALAGALPASAEAPAAAYEDRWQAFLTTAEYGEVMSSFAVYNALTATAEVDADQCLEYAQVLASALQEVPVSLALLQVRAQCVALLDRPQRAQAAAEALRAEAEAALAGGRGRSSLRPIRVVSEADAMALLAILGHQPLYGRYVYTSPSGGLPLAVMYYNQANAREEVLYFDFLRVWQRLQRAEQGAWYPAYLNAMVDRFLASAQESGNATAETAAIGIALARRELVPAEALAQLEAMALEGQIAATMELPGICALQAEVERCARTAGDLVRGLAARDFGEAMVLYAEMLAAGQIEPRKGESAAGWLQRAEQRLGAAPAQTAYAQIASNRSSGELRADVVKALRAAAASGHAPAEFLLARLLREGRISARDEDEAERWTRRAAEHGHAPAQTRLAMDAFRDKKDAEAAQWLLAAAAQEEPSAMGLLGVAYERGTPGIARPADAPDSKTHNAAEALAWYRRAAHAGNGGAMRRLGQIARSGLLGEAPSAGVAEGWLGSAVLAGSQAAVFDLVELYWTEPMGVRGELADVSSVLERMAKAGDPRARLRWAQMRLYGRGTERAISAAVEELAALDAAGMAQATHELARAYAYGAEPEVSADAARAVSLFQRAANADYAPAMDDLAYALLQGEGVTADPVAAIYWWTKAAEKQHTMAQNNLAWVRCTSKNAALQAAAEGLRWAELAVSRERSSTTLDTLAACSAANGNFEQAIADQAEAMRLARDEGVNGEDLAGFSERLEAYRRGEVWRE